MIYTSLILSVVSQENNRKTYQILADNHDWCCEASGTLHPRPHMFMDILELNKPGTFSHQETYEAKRRKIIGSAIMDAAPCAWHRGRTAGCTVPSADFGVSGLPCTDMSICGNRLKRHGPTNSVYMSHGKYTEKHKVPLFIVECTPASCLMNRKRLLCLPVSCPIPTLPSPMRAQDLDMEMMQDVHPSYDMYQLFFDTTLTGHGGAARKRTYIIASRIGSTSCKADPFEVLDFVSRETSKVQTRPSDYMLADWADVHLEAMKVANNRRVCWSPPSEGSEWDLTPLLLPRELQALREYEAQYMMRYGTPAASDRDLVVFLADNPKSRLTWSACSKAIPTQRLNSATGKYWAPALRRWLVGRERLAAMGWPVTEAACSAMSCPIIPTRDILRCSLLAGNAMHFNTVSLAQLLALGCFGPGGD